MYDEILKSLYYSIDFDFGVCYELFVDYVLNGVPLFFTVLGIRLGAWGLKQFCDY